MTGKRGVPACLVVDDDLIMRDMAAQTLRHAGFEVLEAESGEEALRPSRTRSRRFCCCLDVMLPGIDGPRAVPGGCACCRMASACRS